MREAASIGSALDMQGLRELRGKAQNPSGQDLHQVAQQFEAVFVEMMLEQMRSTTPGNELFGGSAEKTYRDLFDRQMAVEMSRDEGGMGLAPMIERQLRRNAGLETEHVQGPPHELADYRRSPVATPPSGGEAPAGSASAEAGAASPAGGPAPGLGDKGPVWSSPEAFVEDLAPAARRTAERLGVAPEALVAQAALETGWGQHVIRDSEGRSSHNLFNIKAQSAGWQGDTVRVPTLEYRQGLPQREMADFRAYDSLEASFNDYAELLESNPRYRRALEVGDDPQAFARELEAAGYATDPAYAEKIQGILERQVEPQMRAGADSLKVSESVPRG